MSERQLHDNIAKLLDRVSRAAQNCERDPADITVLAVSKTRPAADIREAAALGLDQFGENYLQEALDKIEALRDLPLTWHFIGPIQSNKTRAIAGHFDWVHSVDRLKVARRLSEQRPDNLPPLQVCLQVNISGEDSKSGADLDALPELAAAVLELPRLTLRGLMAIPAATGDTAAQRAAFARLRKAMTALGMPQLDTLSMGMSGDLEAAIAEGATIVRVGTDIFGPRG
ncbi:YggS family pyridoxal phosphate-dependent enzyme [Parahaliea mediterranea]|uniref:Pyridoxal phosphate homeostasis protein n=1 Tax=Parahaliea mediterranea TaxID=651086 RepID=A0A939IKF7_9GAMM|nr:YggS family pyridoxal phosphate-dependent enzyme [Parahaliea mediterranea]MBN7797281.1 YggS family pyridoxal phosphate-dependent enzyme [Parahaliea mediterranea]